MVVHVYVVCLDLLIDHVDKHIKVLNNVNAKEFHVIIYLTSDIPDEV